MKKKILAALILSALTLSFAGCSGSDNSSNSTDVNNSTSSSSDVQDSENESNTESDSGAESDSIADSESDSDTNSSAEEDNADSDAPTEESSSKAGILGAAAINANEWPGLDMITDAEIIEAFFGFPADHAEDYYLAIPALSANIEEIVIVKPAAGYEDEIKTALENHLSIKTDAMNIYPSQEEIAAGAVSGTTDDGYCYVIIHKDGAAIEQTMLAAE